MKSRWFLSVILIAALGLLMTSCFLFPKVKVEDTKDFVNDFEKTMTDPTSEIDGENGTLAMGATSDFFNKGGTSKGGFSFNFIDMTNFLRPKFKGSKLLFDDVYGTYTYSDAEYMFVLTDNSTPANGYLFKWTYIDTSVTPNENHNVELLFDSILYYAGDPDQSTPTKLYISLGVDATTLMFLNFKATYVTVVDEYDYENYIPVTLNTHFEITDEAAFELDYVGHEADNDVEIDSVRAKIEDFIDDEWVEYTLKINDDESGKFTMENNEGWLMTVNADKPVDVDETYTRIDFEGDLKFKGTHAADLNGVVWSPSDYLTHQSVMYVVYPDGTEDTIPLGQAAK